MRRLLYLFSTPLLIMLVCVLATCDNEQEQIDPLIEYIAYNDLGCPIDLFKTLQNNDYLYDWQLNDDLLSFDFRFSNTCGRAYKDSVSIMQDTISICLTDTSTMHARCICEHQCQFEFLVEGTDHIQLLMEIGIRVDGEYVYHPCVDTLLQW